MRLFAFPDMPRTAVVKLLTHRPAFVLMLVLTLLAGCAINYYSDTGGDAGNDTGTPSSDTDTRTASLGITLFR